MNFEQRELDETKVTMPTPENPRGYSIKFAGPVSHRENMRLAYQKKAYWIPNATDASWFIPEVIPDSIARAMVMENGRYTGPVGGKDMFNVDWEFVPSARGSIVRPGNPTLTDITKWKEVIQFPNVDSWDWEGSAAKNKEYLENADTFQNLTLFTGWFERLISFMDFGPAAYALMNKKQQPYVKELFEKLSDLWIDIIDHAAKAYGKGIDGIVIHDDWGAQHSPFFNPKIVYEMLVPYMKKVTDHIHELGYVAELHCCGKVEKLVECMVAAGWDSWEGMSINDYHWIHENFGGKLICLVEGSFAPDADEETAKEAAKAYFEEYGQQDKPEFIGMYTPRVPAFNLELYRLARTNYENE